LLQLHHRNSEFLPHLTHCESHSLAFPCKSQKDKLPLLDVNAFADIDIGQWVGFIG
jgi:hypothetical protein